MALIFSTAVLHLAVLPAQTRQLHAQHQAADALRRQALATNTTRTALLDAQAHPLEALQQALQQTLPIARERQPRVAELLALAARHGVSVPRSEYRYSTEAASGLAGFAGYRITLPAVGRYAALRRFVEDALAQDPALTLDSLRLRRAHAQAADLQAEIKLTLWMQAEGDEPRGTKKGVAP